MELSSLLDNSIHFLQLAFSVLIEEGWLTMQYTDRINSVAMSNQPPESLSKANRFGALHVDVMLGTVNSARKHLRLVDVSIWDVGSSGRSVKQTRRIKLNIAK
jgi:hypothetical protein